MSARDDPSSLLGWEEGVSSRDCGGVYGYADIVRLVKDLKFEPDGQSREEILEWLGGEFDPEAFSA
jgi:Plasmid pRiA4b ORF-3-like protein